MQENKMSKVEEKECPYCGGTGLNGYKNDGFGYCVYCVDGKIVSNKPTTEKEQGNGRV